MTVQDKVLSKTLEIKNGKLLRKVEDIFAIEKLIKILKEKGYIGSTVIDTQIFSQEENLVEHEILKYIIHSGEYTESMAYDVNLQSLKMALDLVDEGVFAYDLLPHNFTFHNGKWFLYDFDSFQLKPEKVITEIRGFFKIIFSNYEILRLISRKELGHYYLTRYRIEDIIHLIPLHRWLYLFLNQTICNILFKTKQYKLVYKYINNLFKKYSKKHKKNYYNYQNNNDYTYINNEIKQNNISSIFCVGETSAKWAIDSKFTGIKAQKLVYIDNYDICDAYYNYIITTERKDIIPSVLYPLVDEKEIKEEYKYRALYDSYAQERFYSDVVMYLESEINESIIEKLAIFTKEILIIKNSDKHIDQLKKIFANVEITNDYLIAKNKIEEKIPVANKPYEDGNRGPDAHRQTWEVQKIIKSKRITKN
ncbi:MAG: hypothetical protein E7Z90_05875 [Cyanobacteria bacterium SIG29]|nr:hypothetical protein [Cyanobacteria bacterium SIG29]